VTPNAQLKQLRALQASPAAFQDTLLIDSDGGAQRLSAVCDPWQKRDFESLDSGWRAVAGHKIERPALRAWLERSRGHSKTSDIAVMLAWVLFASPRRLSGVVAAADRDQARLLRDAVSKLVQLNPWLAKYVEVQEGKILNPHTGSECVVIASDVASSYGLLCDFIIADEVAHWLRRGLFDSLLSTAAKRKTCLFLCITNAGFEDSWVWVVRQAIRNDPAWYFSRLDGPKAKWITPDRLAEQRRLLPDIAYRRLWLNVWSGGSGDALHPDDLTAALTQAEPMRGDELGYAFVAGLDIGISHDASALVTLGVHVGHTETIAAPKAKLSGTLAALVDAGLMDVKRREPQRVHHSGTGRVRLAAVEIWQPRDGNRVDLTEVEAAIVAVNERFGLSCVACDPWQSELMVQRLQRRGLPVYLLQQTGINLQAQASAVLDGFRERIIDLYPCDQLLADLRGLQVAERHYGFRLVSPRATRTDTHATAHGDSATGFSLGMLAAKRAVLRPAREVPGKLVLWPTGK
jgi:phage terminase large subunit-like protein